MEMIENPEAQEENANEATGMLSESNPILLAADDFNHAIVLNTNEHADTTPANAVLEDQTSQPNIDFDKDTSNDGNQKESTQIITDDPSNMNDDDLEDGEIETDDDEPIITNIVPPDKSKDAISKFLSPTSTYKSLAIDGSDSIASSVSENERLPSAKKNKFRRMEIMDDDWAGNIENAIAAALKKDGIEPPMPKLDKRSTNTSVDNKDPVDEVKRSRKRKKRDEKDKNKKRMKHLESEHHSVKLDADEIDEDEMVCVRGGSPTPTMSSGGPMQNFPSHRNRRSPSPHSGIFNDSDDSYQSSYDSFDSAENRKMNFEERRQSRRNKDRRNRAGSGQTGGSGGRGGGPGKRRNRHESDGDDCPRAHDARAPRKLELCKFYLMDCCAKKDKCSYMHSDFPCKYYYLGMECVYKSECKFSHGDPLTEQLKNILLKHIETAPKEILGNFRRISRENATNLLLTTHAKLCAEKGIENKSLPAPAPQTFSRQSRSPSVSRGGNSMSQPFARKSHSPPDTRPGNPFAGSAPLPQPSSYNDEENWDNEDWEKPQNSANSNSSPVSNSNLSMSKACEKTRKSRWQDFMSSQSGSFGNSQSSDILSLKNLKGVITPEQIKRLENIGIENLEQISQLTVAQLNNVGLTIGQINEIQLNAMNIEKLGLIASQNSPAASVTPPIASSQNNTNNSSHSSKLYNDDNSQSVQDVDMRCLVGAVQASGTTSSQSILAARQLTEPSTVSASMSSQSSQHQDLMLTSPESVPQTGNAMSVDNDIMDFSQYLKDSNVKDADKTSFNDLLKEEDDALNEDEPELLIDESRCAGSDDEVEANSEDTYSLSAGQVSSKVFTTKGEDDDDWDDDSATPTTSYAIQTNSTPSSNNNLDNDDWQEDATESWQPINNNRSHQNKNTEWQDDSNNARGNRWKNKNKNDSWQDKSKNDSGIDKGRNDSWQEKNRSDTWQDRGRNEPWKEKNRNDSWQPKGRNDAWQQKSDSWQEKRDPWQQKDSSPDFYGATDAGRIDYYGSAGNSSKLDDQPFGNRKQPRSDPRKNFDAPYDNKDSIFESGSNSTTGQYRDPRLGSGNTSGFAASDSRRTSSSSQLKSNVDNYDGDWDAEEDHTSSQMDNSAQDEEASASVMHQDVIPIVIREPSPPPKYLRASIYDGAAAGNGDDDDENSRCGDDEGREYAGDRDMRMPTFLESGDIDLRLPFKPVMTNYIPATEIEGSIASHSPIPYKVYEVSIPKPDYSEIRRTMTVTDKTLDPRLRRIFCLKEPIVDQYGSDSETLKSPPHTAASILLGSVSKPSDPVEKVGPSLSIGGPRMDPRRRKDNLDLLSPTSLLTKQIGLVNSGSTGLGQNVDIRMLLQKSMWYKNLNSKYKIMVNQQLALVSTELKKFHQDNNPDKVFDMKFLATNQYLQQVLTNLGIFIDGNGQILQLDCENDDPMITGPSGGPGMMLPGPGMMMEGVPPMGLGLDFMRPPQPTGMPPMNSRFMGPASMLNSFASRFGSDVRPGLLGVSPPINPFNPFDTNPPNNQFSGGLYGGPNGPDDYGGEQHHQSGNPFDQGANDAGGKFYGGMDRPQGGGQRGMNRNFRQGNSRNNNDRWTSGGGPGNQGSGRNNQGRNRHFENRGGGGGDRDGRRGEKQNVQQQPPPQVEQQPQEEEESWD